MSSNDYNLLIIIFIVVVLFLFMKENFFQYGSYLSNKKETGKGCRYNYECLSNICRLNNMYDVYKTCK